ncbi:MAG TPA: serine hydrolase domain-containing protein [Thermoanaerobaculia bacterium]|nr:serine hydrolase domain-containing protein [Thermoanaerobaculia bacterium]
MKSIFGLLVFLLSAVPVVAGAPLPEARIDEIFAPWSHTGSPGCALGVARGGRVVLERGYGMADLENGRALTPASVFDVGSIAKQFTAFSVALLAERGKLSLDDDVRRYIPELPEYGRTITLRHLMQHTSGLRDVNGLVNLAGWRPLDEVQEEDALRLLTRQKGLNFEPGSDVLYCNSGFFLLGLVVRRVSGQTLAEFARDNVFTPLGMERTSFRSDLTSLVKNRATGYQQKGEGSWQLGIERSAIAGPGGLLSTVGDLLKWEHNFATREIGGGVLAEMVKPGLFSNGQEIDFEKTGDRYGLGLELGSYRGLQTVAHGGTTRGFQSYLMRFPKPDVSIAVLCNSPAIDPLGLALAVADVVLEPELSPVPAPEAPPPGIALSPEQLARLAGVYQDPVSRRVYRFRVEDGRLVLARMSGNLLLEPLSETRFRPAGFANAEIRFPEPAPGAVPEMHLRNPGQKSPEICRRISADASPYSLSAKELQAYAGRYLSSEVDTFWTLSVHENGLALLGEKDLEPELFQPVLPDLFRSPGGGYLEFRRDRAGQIAGLAVFADRIRNFPFERDRGWHPSG